MDEDAALSANYVKPDQMGDHLCSIVSDKELAREQSPFQ